MKSEKDRGIRVRRGSCALLFVILVWGSTHYATATTFVVTTTADGNNGACTVSLCTLRDAVIAANANPGADVITLPAGTYMLTLAGANEDNAATGDLDVRGDLTINGAGAATTIIDGAALDRVFQTPVTAALTINDVTIRNGLPPGSFDSGGGILAANGPVTLNNCVVTGNKAAGQGGGIFATTVTLNNTTVTNNQSTGDQGGGLFATNATITNSTISNNQSPTDQGGGIFLINGASTITNSTISGNTANQEGGAIYLNGSISVANPALLTMTNSTVSNNTSTTGSGGGLFILSQATVTFVSSTIASNSAPTNGGNLSNSGASVTLTNTIVSNPVSGTNCNGTFTNGGGNLQFPGTSCGAAITVGDPLLQALANNGGPTQTRSLSAGSPALNAGSGCPPPATDQRGISRPQGSACEIGSFECQTGECGGIVATPTPTPTGAVTATPTAVAPTATRTPTTGGPAVVVPTLAWPMLVFFGMALAAAAALLLKRS